MRAPRFTLCVLAVALTPVFGAPGAARADSWRVVQAEGTISLAEAVRRVEGRWRGQILSVDMVSGRPGEATDLVYAVRLLAPSGSLIRIRIDARDGAYLGAAGRGLVGARILPGGTESAPQPASGDDDDRDDDDWGDDGRGDD